MAMQPAYEVPEYLSPNDAEALTQIDPTAVIDYQNYTRIFRQEFKVNEEGVMQDPGLSVFVIEDEIPYKELIAKTVKTALAQLKQSNIATPPVHFVYMTHERDGIDLRKPAGENVTSVAKIPYEDGFSGETLVPALLPHMHAKRFIAFIDQNLGINAPNRSGENVFRGIASRLKRAVPEAQKIRTIFATVNPETVIVDPKSTGISGLFPGGDPEIMYDKNASAYLRIFHEELKLLTGHDQKIEDLMKTPIRH